MKTVSIGLIQEHGFRVLVTLNNNDEIIADFDSIIQKIQAELTASLNQPVQVLERQDAPDYVDLDI